MSLDTTAALLADHKELIDLIGKLLGILGGGGIIGLLTLFATKTLPWWRTRRDRRSLEKSVGAELYPKGVIERSTQYYIEPYCQVLDPAGAEEPRHLAFNPKDNLFKVIDEALYHPTEYRYLILLADSGMGKTSFLLNYYARYLRRRKRDFALQLVPLGIPDADARIGKIENKSKTVLFLDALDEDTLAIVDHAARLSDLLKLTRDFQKVLITCRTQFFPKEEEIPEETGVVKIGPRPAGEAAQYVFHKLYLSPFTDNQVQIYLKRHYTIWQRRQRNLAEAMVKKIPNLSVRPMLLAHIEDLVAVNREIRYSFELYEEMVEAWLKREEGIFAGLKKDPLRQFSERLAVDLYANRQRRGAERIPRSELAGLAKTWNIALDEWQLSGRSLLNRDAKGNYKFAHRSIMEYLYVKRLIGGDRACQEADLTDQMKDFWVEIISTIEKWSVPVEMHDFVWNLMQQMSALTPLLVDFTKIDLGKYRPSLRSYPMPILTEEYAKFMLKQLDFFDSSWHSKGKGIAHQYELQEKGGLKVVIDQATGLMWQQSGSPESITYADAEKYIRELNDKRFAGYHDWRLPTLEQAMSLMEPKKHGDLYLDPIFDRTLRWIWTADKDSAGRAWCVYFIGGYCVRYDVGYGYCVRAVRS